MILSLYSEQKTRWIFFLSLHTDQIQNRLEKQLRGTNQRLNQKSRGKNNNKKHTENNYFFLSKEKVFAL